MLVSNLFEWVTPFDDVQWLLDVGSEATLLHDAVSHRVNVEELRVLTEHPINLLFDGEQCIGVFELLDGLAANDVGVEEVEFLDYEAHDKRENGALHIEHER